MTDKEKDQFATLTARDKELAMVALLAHKSPWDLDWAVITRLAPYKNENTARTCFMPVKRKLLAVRESLASNSGDDATPTLPQTPKKRSTPNAKPGTTGKRGRPSKRKAADISPDVNDDDQDEGFAGSDAEAGGGGTGAKKRVKHERKFQLRDSVPSPA